MRDRLFRIGLNPYGVAYTVGLQGLGTARANPAGLGLDGFIDLAREIGARAIEIDWRWLIALDGDALARVRRRLEGLVPLCSFWLSHQPGETLSDAIRCARGLGASLVRLHLTPVLEGARAAHGDAWPRLLDHARSTLGREAPRAADAGVALAIENHQDLGSEELLAFAEEAGAHVGIVLDTGNPFAVGEDPVEFVRRTARRIRHVHLKDYRAQFIPEGYRLVRCALGDGCVPFEEIAAALATEGTELTASIELGALDARHIRLFDRYWWTGYPSRDARELATALARLRRRELGPHEDYRTPWELAGAPEQIVAFEREQLERSVEWLRTMKWL